MLSGEATNANFVVVFTAVETRTPAITRPDQYDLKYRIFN